MKKPESVLVLIYNQHQQVLVMQRLDDPQFWQSVTGSLEEGEIPIQAALREVLEETGIDVDKRGYTLVDGQKNHYYLIRPQWRHRYAEGVTHNLEHVFHLQVDADIPIVLTEHEDYRWLDAQKAIELVWSQTNKQLIRSVLLSEAEN